MIYYFVLTERMTVLTMLSCMNLNSTLIRLAVGCVYVAVVCINVSDCVWGGPQEECPVLMQVLMGIISGRCQYFMFKRLSPDTDDMPVFHASLVPLSPNCTLRCVIISKRVHANELD